MNICERYGASVGIDARNAGKHLFAAKVEWRVDERRPALKFYCDGAAIDDDREDDELAVAELNAQFSDIAFVDR
jgi:hypothetical protein